jgi:hypothetical protein
VDRVARAAKRAEVSRGTGDLTTTVGIEQYTSTADVSYNSAHTFCISTTLPTGSALCLTDSKHLPILPVVLNRGFYRVLRGRLTIRVLRPLPAFLGCSFHRPHTVQLYILL